MKVFNESEPTKGDETGEALIYFTKKEAREFYWLVEEASKVVPDTAKLRRIGRKMKKGLEACLVCF